MSQYTDDYLLSLTHLGSGILGADLYAAVQACAKRRQADASGKAILGPGILGVPAVEIPITGQTATREQLDGLAYATLRGLATERNIPFVGLPKKADLIDALLQVDAVITPDEVA